MWSSVRGPLSVERSPGILAVGVLLLAGCDRNGRDLVTLYDEAYDPVIELGEVAVLPNESGISQEFCAEEDEDGKLNCVYANVGTPEPGVTGGATFTFKGTGDTVCVVVDPEAVFWNQSISPLEPDPVYMYPDKTEDDGDADLFAGLSSYYTGSPGVELGDFKGFYTDSAGSTVEIEYSECSQTGYGGLSDAHAGRGAPEYCGVNTKERVGVEYTVVVQTFSTPPDDGVLSFAAAAFDGQCRGIGITECTLPEEVLDPDTGEIKPEFAGLETAFCNSELTEYCCEHPEVCGEDPPEGACGEEEEEQ